MSPAAIQYNHFLIRSLQRIESNNEPAADITDNNLDNIETTNNGDTVSISVSISNSNPNLSEIGELANL